LLGRFIAVAILPIHLFSHIKFPTWPWRARFWWIHTHICLYMALHIHDPDNASAAIATLVKHIKSKLKRPLVVYGVVSDFYHCIIMRVSNKKGAYVVSRTATLDFIPTLYAKNPSTPGITTLVRLGNINVPDDTWFFYTGLRRMWWSNPGGHIHDQPPPSSSLFLTVASTKRISTISDLPLELITEIGTYLSTCLDLNALAVLCKHTISACVPLLRFPQLVNTNPLAPNEHGYILTSVASGRGRGRDSHRDRMFSGEFIADFNERKVVVIVGVESVFKEQRFDDVDENWDEDDDDDSGESSIEDSESSIEGSSEDSSLLMDVDDDEPTQLIKRAIPGSFYLRG
ncbi:hypothetical protein BDY19DRAFT_1032302, partial [Irpex rosettiformis]